MINLSSWLLPPSTHDGCPPYPTRVLTPCIRWPWKSLYLLCSDALTPHTRSLFNMDMESQTDTHTKQLLSVDALLSMLGL